MKKIITFLGTSPKQTQYLWNGQVYTGSVFAEALYRMPGCSDFERMLVCVTPEAEERSWPILQALADPRIQCVRIPIGRDIEDMWRIFEVILDHVEENDRVIFDITHGLRSIPFLSFLFAAFLKTARAVTIEAILYGAFELGRDGAPAPVLDLSDFVEMLEWTAATDQFVQTGDARRLADLLQASGARDDDASASARRAADQLRQVSLAAMLCQSQSLMQLVGDLEPGLAEAEGAFQSTSRPFQALSQRITREFSPFAAASLQDVPASLLSQLRMVRWYRGNNQLIQAATLAREWLIDAVAWRLGLPLTLSRTSRGPVENAISGLVKIGGPHPDGAGRIFTIQDLNQFGLEIWDHWEECQDLKYIWTRLSDIRNQQNHAEHQVNVIRVENLVKKMSQVLPKLEALARAWGIEAAP